MAKFFHNKGDLIFWAIALVFFSLLAFFALYSAAFFVEKLNAVFNPSLIKGEEIASFNLDQARRLKAR